MKGQYHFFSHYFNLKKLFLYGSIIIMGLVGFIYYLYLEEKERFYDEMSKLYGYKITEEKLSEINRIRGILVNGLINEKQDIFYIIKPLPTHYLFVKNGDTSEIPAPQPPPPAPLFYGHHNFILKDTSTIYYYKADYEGLFLWCGTGVDENNPPKINLSSEQVVQIPLKILPNLLNKIIPDSIQNIHDVVASISSPTDTIRNRGFEIITKYFKSKGVNIYNIRNWTDEERSVLKNK